MQKYDEGVYTYMANIKNIFIKICCILIVMSVLLISGCNEKEDNDSGSIICGGWPVEVRMNDINILLRKWYYVQTNASEAADVDKFFREDDLAFIEKRLKNKPHLTYPIIKNESYELLKIDFTYDDVNDIAKSPVWFYFRFLGSDFEFDEHICVFIFYPDSSYYSEILEVRQAEEIGNGLLYDKEQNTWYLFKGMEVIRIEFPETIDSSSHDVIHEYFDFNTISVAEYESMMQ